MLNIFQFEAYRPYLRAVIDENKGRRGYQRLLAQAAGCHTSYFSQVMNSHIQLTPDQAAGLAQFWDMDEAQTEYFLGLVHLDRAGSPALKLHLTKRLKVLREKNVRLTDRIGAPSSVLGIEAQAMYYSTWYYAAIHMLVSIPAFRTAENLAKQLSLPLGVIKTALENLATMGLVQQGPSEWIPTAKIIHISDRSPLNASNHAHWRQLATLRIQEGRAGETHYSACYALSHADYKKLREEVLALVAQSRAIVGPSQEETAAIFTVDLFQL